MLLKINQTGQPILRKQAKPVSLEVLAEDSTQELIDNMIATLRDAPGVGLAAQQVGQLLQIIIIDDKAKYHELIPPEVLHKQRRKPVPLKVLVNPSLELINKTTSLWFEGCLSIDGYVAAVPRDRAVRVNAWDRNGKPITYVAHGWHARILQHELDHLNGILFIDQMHFKSFMSLKNFNNIWRKTFQPDIIKAFGNENASKRTPAKKSA